MKICHVNLASGFSGGEQQTLQLLKRQVRDGLSPVLVANEKGLLAYEARRVGCQVITTKHFSKQHSKKITQDCDAMHVHEGRAIYWALIQHLRHGIPYIITRRIDNPIQLKLTNKFAYNRASALVGLSSAIVSRLEEHFDSSKIYKIPSSPVSYPVDQNKLDQIWNRYRGKFIIIQAAKMLEHKGFDTTIQAARSLCSVTPPIPELT
ncbi:MAG: glycosyltransferase family 1 protein, partial [Vibrio sp.]